jgi:hypothetical protein
MFSFFMKFTHLIVELAKCHSRRNDEDPIAPSTVGYVRISCVSSLPIVMTCFQCSSTDAVSLPPTGNCGRHTERQSLDIREVHSIGRHNTFTLARDPSTASHEQEMPLPIGCSSAWTMMESHIPAHVLSDEGRNDPIIIDLPYVDPVTLHYLYEAQRRIYDARVQCVAISQASLESL